MRYLTIVRHAKAEKDNPAGDAARVLSPRGQRQCAQLREWAKDPAALGGFGPVTALVSSAMRTRETYALAFAGTSFVHAVETSDLIYNGRRAVGAEDLLSELASIDPVIESLAVVAHNPTVSELVMLLDESHRTPFGNERFPTGAAVVFELRDEPVGRGPFRLVAFYAPDAE